VPTNHQQSESRVPKQGEASRGAQQLSLDETQNSGLDNADQKKLEQLIDGPQQLALQAQLLAKRRAVALSVALVAGTAFLVLLADVLFQYERWWARWLGPILVITAFVVAWGRLILPAWRKRLTAREIVTWAQRNGASSDAGLLEAFELACHDRRSGQSAGNGDGRYGSQGFRSAALRNWLSTHEIPTWPDYLDRVGWWRSVLVLSVVLLGLTAFFMSGAKSALFAAQRLVLPSSSLSWPQQDELRILDPPKTVAVDTQVRLNVFDARPPMPENLRVWVRPVGQRARPVETTTLGELAVAQLGKLRAEVEVRATGGDDQKMPWQTIRVVTPPQIDDFVFRIQPPSYSGLPDKEVIAKQISVLAGSKVLLSGSFASRLKELSTTFGSTASGSGLDKTDSTLNQPDSWHVLLEPDLKRFTVGSQTGQPILVSSALRWQFIVATQQGESLKLPAVWSISMIRDRPPQVDMAQPDLAAATADGAIAVVGKVTDDLGIAQIEIVASYGDRQIRESVSIADPLLTDIAADLALQDLQIKAPADDSAADIAVEISIEATDSLGQMTKSTPLPLQIKSKQGFLRAIVGEQAELSREMATILTRQRDAMLDMDGVAANLQRDSQVTERAANQLLQLAKKQQTIREELSTQEGLARRVADLNGSLAQNQLANTPIARSLRDLGSELNTLATQNATAAARNLDRAATVAQSSAAGQTGASTALETSLTDALRDVRKIVDGIQTLRSELAARQVASDLADRLLRTAREQEVLKRETGRLALAASSGELSSSRIADLADRQGRLSRELGGVIEQALKTRTGKVTPPNAEQLSEAAEEIKGASITDLMRAAEERIRQSEYAQAAQLQTQLSMELQNALESSGLRNKGVSTEIEQSGRALTEALEQTKELAARQDKLAKAVEELFASGRGDRDGLQSAQMDLVSDTDRFRNVVSGTDPTLSEGLGKVVGLQQKAIEKLENEQMTAPQDMRAAADELYRLSGGVAQRKARLDAEQKRQQQFDLVEIVAEAATVQEKLTATSESFVVDETNQALLEQTRNARLPKQIERVRQVSAMLADRPAFLWVAKKVEQHVKLQQAALARERFAEALVLSGRAHRRLVIMSKTLQDSIDDGKQDADDRGDREQAQLGQQDDSREGTSQLAVSDLQLLRAIQAAIQEATQQADPSELQELALEQRELFEQLRSLVEQ